MNWLRDFVKPKIRALVSKKNVPDDLWTKCSNCEQMIFHRELASNLQVCPHCSYHMRMNATSRLQMLFDNAEYRIIEFPTGLADPLKFKDTKKYTDRLKENRAKTNNQDAIIAAHGKMGGVGVVIAAFDFDFMGGSMSIATGEALLSASRLAILQQAPLIVIPASGGARMQEGILSLMQMARTVAAIQEVKEAGLPYIVLLADPTYGGVSASFAMLGDIAISEPGAMIGFAGRRVIQETIREKLPNDFQKAEYLLDHGMIDMVVTRRELRPMMIKILSLLQNKTPSAQVLAIKKK
ncbi:MAG: acetyl-CoA carboxylase, carboxyltransferase subunit beta [Alphaproteobacteria bacterium]|nr:acetyl-CoA carboxylase, carboxyltransferase subunit beta [Alphaproteobacteria bacterium]